MFCFQVVRSSRDTGGGVVRPLRTAQHRLWSFDCKDGAKREPVWREQVKQRIVHCNSRCCALRFTMRAPIKATYELLVCASLPPSCTTVHVLTMGKGRGCMHRDSRGLPMMTNRSTSLSPGLTSSFPEPRAHFQWRPMSTGSPCSSVVC
jgi:hypothetical protein